MKTTGLIFGVAFGFMLGWARLTDYDVIRNMLLLREFDVYLMMGAAVITAAIGTRLLRRFGVVSLVGSTPISWNLTKPSLNHVYGSVIFGLGWGIAGTCPGPVAAQLGRGQLSAIFTLAGIFGGIALYGWIKQRAERQAAAAVKPGIAGAIPGM